MRIATSTLPILSLVAGAIPLPAQAPLVLADGGKSAYRIVLPADAIPSEKYAAAEFRAFFRQMSGADLPVVDESSPPSDREICLNARKRIAAADPAFAKKTPGGDGYAIRTKGGRLLVLGDRPRGTLYAVYVLLEEHLGCRWFTREVSRIPKKDRWELPPLDLAFAPALESREVFWTEAFDGDWAAQNRLNGHEHRLEDKHGGKIDWYPFVHSFDKILDHPTHFKAHPEYFAEVDGRRRGADPNQRTQLCLTNPEVLKIAIETVRKWMKKKSDVTVFSVSQNDWNGHCACAKCRAIDEREGSPSGSLLTFVNAVAEAVEKEFPDKLIDTLAYQYSRKPPKTVRPRKNVRVRLCSFECCFSHPLDSPTCEKNKGFREDLVAWSKITDRLYIWDYTTNYSHYVSPFPNFDVLGPNVRFYVDHGVKSIFEQGNMSPGGGGEFSELRSYVLAKLLWNPKTDVKKAIEEFTDAVYAEAGPKVREYIELLHAPARSDPKMHATLYLPPKQSGWFSGEFVKQAEALFAEGLAAVKDEAARKRLRKAALPIDYLQVLRADPGTPQREKRLAAFLAACKEFGITNTSEHTGLEEFAKKLK